MMSSGTEAEADPLRAEPGAQRGNTTEVRAGGKSYGQILKSSTIIGGSSLVNVLVAIVRVKVNAVLLGPGGVGLFGLYNSITEISASLADLGIRSSGVRQIAAAASTNDQVQITRTVLTLRRVALILGCLGAVALFLLRKPVCALTFGSLVHANEVAVLPLVVFCGAVSGGQAALVQGMRRIGDLARMSIIGAVLGTALSVSIIFAFREHGIVWSLAAVSAMGILTSWWYARKIRVRRVHIGWNESREETQRLLSLGLVVTANGLMTAGVTYITRLLIIGRFGLDAVGLYQSASALSIMYAGFILDAMGTDFYPRLTAAAKDDATCNRLVNEQAEIGLLLAVPGVLATLTFAPLVIQVFYSARFGPAADILRWQILGMLLRVAAWPMAFILPAKELKRAYFWTELIFNVANLGLVWVCLRVWGLTGVGIAFFALFLFFWCLMFFLVRRITGFSWSAANARLGLLLFPAVAVVFLSSCFVPPMAAMVVGTVVTLLVGFHNLVMLRRAVGADGVDFIARKLGRLRR